MLRRTDSLQDSRPKNEPYHGGIILLHDTL